MECRVSEPKSEFLSLLTSQGRRAFDHDIESLATDRIVHHFPWDAAGRPALKSIVLLAAYDTVNAPRKDRDLCLAAVGPEHRSEQVVRVELIDPILANQAHRWDRCPWLWTSAEVPVDELLGTASAGAADENQRAMEALAWLDEGRIEEALALYRVSVSDDLHRLLGGERIESASVLCPSRRCMDQASCRYPSPHSPVASPHGCCIRGGAPKGMGGTEERTAAARTESEVGHFSGPAPQSKGEPDADGRRGWQ